MTRRVFLEGTWMDLGGFSLPAAGALPPGAAARALRRATRDPEAMAALRRALCEATGRLRLGDDAAVIDELCLLIERRRLRLFPAARPALFSLGTSTDESPAPAPPPSAPRELHWVAFVLVDDEGQPVPGLRFRADLADGRRVSGSLDGGGAARWDDVASSGACTIVFPEIDADFGHFSSDDPEDPALAGPRAAAGASRARGTLYRPGTPGTGPTDLEHVFHLPGWRPIRMLAAEEEPTPAPPPEPPSPRDPPEPITDGDVDWNPVAMMVDAPDAADE